MTAIRNRALVPILAVLVGCSSTPAPDAGVVADTGLTDSGPVAADTGLSGDAGRPDAGPDAGPAPFRPEVSCPGGPSCAAAGDGVFKAGVATRAITPVIDANTEVLTRDVNGNAEYDLNQDAFDDKNGNGLFDGVWMAGFGNPRPASGVNDDQWVRALAVEQNGTRVVFVAIDCVGYFKYEMDQIRELVADQNIDAFIIAATHTHEARDTVGLWGIDATTSGVDPAFNASVRTKAAEAIREAVSRLEPATVQSVSFRLSQVDTRSLDRYVTDVRDPHVIDDEVRVLRFKRRTGGTTIATFVNWSAHPEYFGDRNSRLSSDYPHYLRQAIESGVDGPMGRVDGVGGTAVFFQGALGSQIGPGRLRAQTWAGADVQKYSEDAARTVGEQVGYQVLRALASGQGAVEEEAPRLEARTRTFYLDVVNRGFQIAFQTVFTEHPTFNWDPERVLIPGRNEPDILTEVAYVRIGRIGLVSIPGELDPVLFVGGYDGAYTPTGSPVVDTTQTNPPELARAPAAPYLRDLAIADGAESVCLLGLSQDYVGYLIPAFDFEVDRGAPYLVEAPGDHYEETRALGPNAWPTIESEVTQLIAWPVP